MNEPLLPFPDAGRFLGFKGKSSGKTTIHKFCKDGRLTKVKLGGRSFVTRASAEALIRNSIVKRAACNDNAHEPAAYGEHLDQTDFQDSVAEAPHVTGDPPG